MTRPFHAVMVTPSAVGGHPRYTWELMSALRDEAPEAELRLTLLTSADLASEFRQAEYNIVDVLPPLRARDAFANRAHWAASRVWHYARREETVLRWVRAQERVDIVHYQEPPFAAALHYARVRAAGAYPVATVHNLRPHRYHISAARGLTDLAARLAWRQCSTLFVHSSGLAAQMAMELGGDAPPIVAIPHGVWTGHENASLAPRRDGYLLLFGVMRRNKGVHLMLDALAHLPSKRLVLAGEFADRAFAAEVRERIASEGLNVDVRDRVIPEAEVPELFAGASLVMLPYTDFSAQSGVLHLAIGYGVPAVVNDVGALGEEVRKHGIGAISPGMEAVALGQTVMRALEPAAYEEASRRCRALATTLSWATAARLTLSAYYRARFGESRT